MIKSKRWNDSIEPDDGFRLLVCRYRPRALPKARETWDSWQPNLGPSRELHAAWYGKRGRKPTFAEFAKRYVDEMTAQARLIGELATRSASGETITLLCSSACFQAEQCHRTLLKRLIDEYQVERAGVG